MLNKIKCPIAAQAQKTPNQTIIFTAKKTVSFLELHHLIYYYQEKLPKAKSFYLHNTQDLETICLIFAAIRVKKLIYILPPTCPDSEIQALKASQFSNIDALKQLKFKPSYISKADELPTWDLKRPSTLIQSSGSSGSPKRVCHSLKNHYYSYLGLLESIPFTNQDCWALMLPIHHISGLSILFRTIFAKASFYLIDNYKESKWLLEKNISHASMVSAQIFELKNKKSHIKHLLLGGSSISKTCLEQALNISKNLYISYGSTETSSQIYIHKINAKEATPQKGIVHRYCKIKTSEKKHLLIEGASLALGYFQLPNLLQPLEKPFDSMDIAEIKGGNLSILGRSDTMFISGGENIFPETIEKIFLNHPLILNCICLPKDDLKFGQVPILVISSKQNISFTTLKQWAKKLLPSYKIPKAILKWPKAIPDSKQARTQLYKHFKSLTDRL